MPVFMGNQREACVRRELSQFAQDAIAGKATTHYDDMRC